MKAEINKQVELVQIRPLQAILDMENILADESDMLHLWAEENYRDL